MGYLVRMPQLGMSMEAGTVVEWRVDEGEAVEMDDTVVVVESEKTTSDVQSREDGTLRRVLVETGEAVGPGTPIGIVAGADEDISEYEAEGELSSAETSSASGAGGDPPAGADGNSPDRLERSGGDSSKNVKATPGAKKRATDASIDLSEVDGSGPQGVVTEADVDTHLEMTDETDDGDGTQPVRERRPVVGIQQTVSDRLSQSYQEAIHVTLHREYEAETLQLVQSEARDAGIDISLGDLLLKAVGATLRTHPRFNALFEDGEHVLLENVNVGVAVDVPGGLLTPVVDEVDEKSVEAVHTVRSAAIETVRSGDSTTDLLSGGSFTVTNLGPLGVDSFDPVINPPQVAILGVGRVRDDGSMTLSLSFDHRVINGADAARFLDCLVDVLCDEETLVAFFETELSIGEGSPTVPRDVRVRTAEGFSGRYSTAFGDVSFDEPEDAGGTGSAPSPVDHLLGALGSCLSLSIRALAERDDVHVGGIRCDVDGIPEHGPLSEVRVEVTVETDAGDKAVEKLLTKAERACYVSRALSDDLTMSLDWTRG